MPEVLDETPVRVELRCRECGAYSARVHASPEWGPVLVTFVPPDGEERSRLDDDAGPARAVGVHFLEHPTMTPLTSSIEVACGRGRHGRLELDVEELLELYRRAGARPTRAVLAPIDS